MVLAEPLKTLAETPISKDSQPYVALRTTQVDSMPLHGILTTGKNGFVGRASSLDRRRGVLEPFIPNSSAVVIEGRVWNIERKFGRDGLGLFLTADGEDDMLVAALDQIDGELYACRDGSFAYELFDEATSAISVPMGGWRDRHRDSIDVQVMDLKRRQPVLAMNDYERDYGPKTANLVLAQLAHGMQWFLDKKGAVYFGAGETGGSLGTVMDNNGILSLVEPRSGQSLMRNHVHLLWNQTVTELGIDTILSGRDKQKWDRGISRRLGGNVARVLNERLSEARMQEMWKGSYADASALGPYLRLQHFRPEHLMSPEFADISRDLFLNMHQQLREFWWRYDVHLNKIIDFVQNAHVDQGPVALDLEQYKKLQTLTLPLGVYNDPEIDYIADAQRRSKLVVPGGWGYFGYLNPQDDDAFYILTAFILENGYYNKALHEELGFLGLENAMVQTKRRSSVLSPEERLHKEELHSDLARYMAVLPQM